MSQTNPSRSIEEAENVSFSKQSVLEHIQQSYTLGCSEASKALGMKNFYSSCRDLGKKHASEVKETIETKEMK